MGFLHSCKDFQQKYSLDCKTACLSPQDTEPPTMLFNERVLLVFLRGCRFAGMYLSRITWPETYGDMPETEIFNLQPMWWGAASEWRASLPHPKTAVLVLCNLSGNPHLRSQILKCPIDKIPVHEKDAVCGNMQEEVVLTWINYTQDESTVSSLSLIKLPGFVWVFLAFFFVSFFWWGVGFGFFWCLFGFVFLFFGFVSFLVFSYFFYIMWRTI